MRQEGEPSVGEILQSIKKVLARDNRERAGAEHDWASAEHPEDDGETLEADHPDEWNDASDHGNEEAAGELGGESAPLTADGTASAMRDSLAALSILSGPGAAPQTVPPGETSLEGMVREMLRPMLARWLDDHGPAIVERLVQAEIARIAGTKG